MSGSAPKQEPSAERQRRAEIDPDQTHGALSRARKEDSCFSVDKDLHGWRSSDRNPLRHIQSPLASMGGGFLQVAESEAPIKSMRLRTTVSRALQIQHQDLSLQVCGLKVDLVLKRATPIFIRFARLLDNY
jgi:hypothetical protein